MKRISLLLKHSHKNVCIRNHWDRKLSHSSQMQMMHHEGLTARGASLYTQILTSIDGPRNEGIEKYIMGVDH